MRFAHPPEAEMRNVNMFQRHPQSDEINQKLIDFEPLRMALAFLFRNNGKTGAPKKEHALWPHVSASFEFQLEIEWKH